MSDILIQHDGSIDISVGKHRKDISWKHKNVLWSELVRKLAVTHRTSETLAEYNAAKKTRQDDIKDIGGFVGGILNGGRREAKNVLSRQVVSLDVDFAGPDFWENFTLFFDCSAAMYSTHKHSPESPRLRLVLPLTREVDRTEYEAISRKIAGILDIELFDQTTFQPNRLMYWPSTSKDGEFIFKHQDGPWLDADAMLAEYKDWKDSSQWPISEKADKSFRLGMQKQGNPLEKPGVVGAFCRVYSITDAMETFLSDIYEATDDGRYTYKHGSTAAGLVVYEDKFAYSHHGTDPVSGKLCNAFDLVRIHLHGLKDLDAKENTPGSKLPSYVCMIDMATKDPAVRKLMVEERSAEAKADFESALNDLPGGEGEADTDWQEKLDVDNKGNIYGTIDNVRLIFENDPYFKGRIAFDDFEKCEVALRHLPWRKVTWSTRRLNDRDDANIRHYLEKVYGISHMTKTKDAMQVWAQNTVFHPIKDYLTNLAWDGQPRVESLLVDYQGAEDSEYTRVVTRKTLVAAVARIFEPGVKFDTMLVLVGKQGLKKSSLLDKLGGRWFSDSFSFNTLMKNETKACEQIQGVWIVEIAEMAGLAKAEIEAVKHFISKREDRFRVAYGHRTENFPRQCVFFATTNKTDFLRDPTGNRRYWPVPVNVVEPVKNVFDDLSEAEIGQIWAEAVQYYRDGEMLYLPQALVDVAAAVQQQHTEMHPWVPIIEQYLETKVPRGFGTWGRYERQIWLQDNQGKEPDEEVGYRSRVCVHEIWHEALGKRDVIDERSAGVIRNSVTSIGGWIEVKDARRYGSYGLHRRGFFREKSPYISLENDPFLNTIKLEK